MISPRGDSSLYLYSTVTADGSNALDDTTATTVWGGARGVAIYSDANQNVSDFTTTVELPLGSFDGTGIVVNYQGQGTSILGSTISGRMAFAYTNSASSISPTDYSGLSLEFNTTLNGDLTSFGYHILVYVVTSVIDPTATLVQDFSLLDTDPQPLLIQAHSLI